MGYIASTMGVRYFSPKRKPRRKKPFDGEAFMKRLDGVMKRFEREARAWGEPVKVQRIMIHGKGALQLPAKINPKGLIIIPEKGVKTNDKQRI